MAKLGRVTISRDKTRFQIECDSELEAMRVYSALIGAGVMSVGRFDDAALAMLSNFDRLATHLQENQKLEKLCKEVHVRRTQSLSRE